MSNLETSIKEIGYGFGCKNLSETHDSVTKFFSYPNKEDITTKINTMTNEFIKVPFMEKFTGTISEDSMVKTNDEIKANLTKIQEYMNSTDTKDIRDLRILYDYLVELNKLYKYDPKKKHCNIIDIYLKYSDIIHFMMLIASPLFYDMTRQNVPLFFVTEKLFNRCYYTVQSFLYLIGESKSIEQDVPYPIPFKGQSYKHIPRSVSNKFTLSKLIENSVSIPTYYLKIEVGHKLFNHIFIIVKHNDVSVSNYEIIQSYSGEYCPKRKKYSLRAIMDMVRSLSSIFYSETGELPSETAMTPTDAKIWKDYFSVDLSERIQGVNKNCNPSFCISYVFGIIDEKLCYVSINRLINKSEHTITTYLNELLFPLAGKFGIDMRSFHYVIPIEKHFRLAESDKGDVITDKDGKNKTNWFGITQLYKDMPMMTTLLATYQIHNIKDFFSFLTLLERFVELKYAVNTSSICHSNTEHQGGDNDSAYKDKYLKYKYKYLSMK